jgi:hypothetical protein
MFVSTTSNEVEIETVGHPISRISIILYDYPNLKTMIADYATCDINLSVRSSTPFFSFFISKYLEIKKDFEKSSRILNC